MFEIITTALCGAAGALFYGFMDYLRDRKATDSDALVKLIFIVVVGATIAGIFTPVLAEAQTSVFGISVSLAWLSKPRPFPLALTIGVLANKVMPVLIEKVINRIKTSE